MALRLGRLGRLLFNRSNNTGGRGRKALLTGTLAVGALVTGAALEKRRRSKLPVPTQIPHALDAELRESRIMEGRFRYYYRPGEGTPLVFLHSINAAASIYEMKPLFDHFAAHTRRPLYAPDWFGFGLSDRPDVKYRPGLYQRQLRRFLTEDIGPEADVVALSLACEYAATVANAFPTQVRRMVFISPTALGRDRDASIFQRMTLTAGDTLGAFEVFYAQLTRRETLRKYYEGQIFSRQAVIADELVDYAFLSSHTRGSHHAPLYFVEGVLFMNALARKAYSQLVIPTLMVVPTAAPPTVQSFERAGEVQQRNPSTLTLASLDTGLLPQWENLQSLVELITAHLDG